ncbi:MAG: glycosyltransferase [Oscillospiraceae bacterium]|nr:glycosyltransferase [Oscillospiraceae bacterium]
MKKILIVSHAMEIGGAERALLGLLESIDTQLYQVDLFLLRHEGELLKLIPNNINLLPEIPEYTVLERPMKQTLREGHFLLTASRLYGKLKAERFAKKNNLDVSAIAIEYSHKYTKKFMPKIQENTIYDLAISFLTPHYFVAEKVNANKKVAWIHTDYDFIDVDINSELSMWNKFDKIAAVSESVEQSFVKKFPSLKDKVFVFENIMSAKLIVTQSKDNPKLSFSPENINLLSVGRFCHAKNFDNVPEICKIIRNNGLNVKWYLIGYGGDENLICKKIQEENMQDYVIMLGKQENPYPYINMCDVYIQPSRYEGKCVAVREAQMLGKPVIITNYTTSSSQLNNGVDGIIVPMDNRSCGEEIAKILNNKELLEKIKSNCAKNDYSGFEEAKKISYIMNG